MALLALGRSCRISTSFLYSSAITCIYKRPIWPQLSLCGEISALYGTVWPGTRWAKCGRVRPNRTDGSLGPRHWLISDCLSLSLSHCVTYTRQSESWQCLCHCTRVHFPVPPTYHRSPHSPMSNAHPTPASFPNFQLILSNALKSYEKRTKCDLLAHPLAAQLQACESPGDILAIIHQQVQGLDQSQRADERMTKWLNSTITVLYTFSTSLEQRVGLVCLWTWTRDSFSYICFPGIFTRTINLCRSWHPSFSACSSLKFARVIVTPLPDSYGRSCKPGNSIQHL